MAATKNGVSGKNRIEMVAETDASNGAEHVIGIADAFTVEVTVQGVADLLFNRWNADEVDAKAASPKGSKERKADNPELRVFRNADGELCVPGEYLRMAIVNASKRLKDPASPRASAMGLFKAGVVVTTDLASLGCKTWNYLDRRRGVVQRNGINRVRPAMQSGWKATFMVNVIAPEYIDERLLRDAIDRAGRFCGLGDFRPTFGRFNVINWMRRDD